MPDAIFIDGAVAQSEADRPIGRLSSEGRESAPKRPFENPYGLTAATCGSVRAKYGRAESRQCCTDVPL